MFEVVFTGGEFGAEFAKVAVEHHGHGIGAVTAHIDQGVEAAPGTGEEPVDGEEKMGGRQRNYY